MTLPEGRLLRSRVVEDAAEALESALDRELTGYGVLEPQDALLLDAGGAGVITFREGVPEAVHHAGTGRGGPAALADLAVPGPYSLELYEIDGRELDHADERSVPPDMPARRLAGNPDLAARTRAVAPVECEGDAPGSPSRGDEGGAPPGNSSSADAVAAFLEDEQKIEAIREQARSQARQRAEEWDLDGHLE